MCPLRNIAMRDYQESVTTGQTDGQTDAGQSDPYVPLCLAGDTKRVPSLYACLLAPPRASKFDHVFTRITFSTVRGLTHLQNSYTVSSHINSIE